MRQLNIISFSPYAFLNFEQNQYFFYKLRKKSLQIYCKKYKVHFKKYNYHSLISGYKYQRLWYIAINEQCTAHNINIFTRNNMLVTLNENIKIYFKSLLQRLLKLMFQVQIINNNSNLFKHHPVKVILRGHYKGFRFLYRFPLCDA